MKNYDTYSIWKFREEVNRTRYTFVLAPDELFLQEDGLPIAKTRGLQNVVDPLPVIK